jgi:hypothetical protein
MLVKNSNIAVAADGGRTEGDPWRPAYPRLFRIFAGSTLAAVLCGFAALATDGGKGLHPAPFLALATLLAITATCAFLSMLVCLLGEAVIRWWRPQGGSSE